MAKFFLPNPGFELGDRDWTKGVNNTIEKDVVNARSGSWVSKFTGVAASALRSAANPSVGFPCRPGNKFSVSAFVNPVAATAGIGQVRVTWRDKDGVEFVTANGTAIAFGGGAYVQSVLNDTVAPDRTKSVSVEWLISGPPGGTWFIDDFAASGDLVESIPSTAVIASHRIVPADTVGVFDPLIGADKFTEFNAGMSDKWSGVYTFIPSLGANLGELVSFIRRLGRTERLFCFDPDRTVPLNGIVNGMTVDGPITNGTNKIPIKAGPVSTTALVAADYVEVGAQYFQLQRDLEVGPEGTGEMIVFPSVRSTLADGEDIVTDNPKLVARITSDLDWRRVEARPVDLTISWAEV